MIAAMLSGVIIKDAELKVSAAGKEYLLLVVRHDDMLIRVMLFGDDIDALRSLRRGDSCAVVGNLAIGEYQGKPSYSMMAHRAISPAQRKAYKPKSPDNTQAQYKAAAVAQRHLDGELSDDVPW